MSATRNVIVWDPAWAPLADEFAAGLDPVWQLLANPGDPGWLLGEIGSADALVAQRIPREALPLAARLRAFHYPGAGVADLDPACYPAGCQVLNVYEHETPIAEYVLMAMLAHTTRLLTYLETFRAGRWDGSGRVGGETHGELTGRTVGMFGYGHIGQAIASRARAFGMRVAAVAKDPVPPHAVQPDFFAGPERLPELLRQSDFFVVAAPATRETEGAIGAAELGLLPAHAMLINVSRAEIVGEQALYDALAGGRIAGAALDVWYQYPPAGQAGHGSRLPFHQLPNVICTPHYSAWSREMILRRIGRMCEALNRLARGEPPERVVLVGSWRP
jgi:phosphoglycerate dehydrogenase-like enzyme